MDWYVIHTKPRQERRALVNLEQQGYECYLPLLSSEKCRLGVIQVAEEPLFSRYLFIHLDTAQDAKSWGPIRSTKGVSCLLTFGKEAAKVSSKLIETLRNEQHLQINQPVKLFTPGEKVLVVDGPFNGIGAVYQMADGESRAMLLIDLLGKSMEIRISTGSLKKVG